MREIGEEGQGIFFAVMFAKSECMYTVYMYMFVV